MLPILAIITHYITKDSKLKSSLLAIKEIKGSHEGDNITLIVEEVLAN
jgi:hypothetical protein